jgi:hypothetical protein
MQIQSEMTYAARPVPAFPGRHAKGRRTGVPGGTVRRILITALLISGLAAGSAAISGHAASGPRSAPRQTSVKYVPNTPWLY